MIENVVWLESLDTQYIKSEYMFFACGSCSLIGPKLPAALPGKPVFAFVPKYGCNRL